MGLGLRLGLGIAIYCWLHKIGGIFKYEAVACAIFLMKPSLGLKHLGVTLCRRLTFAHKRSLT